MNKKDKYSVDRNEFVSVTLTIKELYGIGEIIFKRPLKVEVLFSSEEGEKDFAHITYDFGMTDKIPLRKDENFLYNYGNTNEDADPIQTVLNTIKFDLMHAFFHYNEDPNYMQIHWALEGQLRDRVSVIDPTDEPEEMHLHCHENKIKVERVMAAVDIIVKDYSLNRDGLPWVTLSRNEARSLAMDILSAINPQR